MTNSVGSIEVVQREVGWCKTLHRYSPELHLSEQTSRLDVSRQRGRFCDKLRWYHEHTLRP